MPIQLVDKPKIEITLNNGQKFSEFAPNFTIVKFDLTKKLLEPNKFEFTICKNEVTLESSDIKFDLRDELLGALVECSLSGSRRDIEGEWKTDEVENFFRGYIQHVNLVRGSVKDKMTIQCTAFSPDARLKGYPRNSSRINDTLKEYVDFILKNASDNARKFKPEDGSYEGTIDWIEGEVNPKSDLAMPYTVQYHESDYDFLKRLAKRYGEFFYYEDGKVIFGAMKEYDPITLRTGVEIDRYDYDLTMNQHTGVVLTEYDYFACNHYGAGIEKQGVHNWDYKVEPFHEMSKSAFNRSTEFFNDEYNSVADCRSARIMDDEASRNLAGAWEEGNQRSIDAKWADLWSRDQRQVLEQYMMADTLVCNGVARRADLKLGSVIVIEDETLTEGDSDFVQHEPLKIIDLTYSWLGNNSRTLENTFKAIPQKATVPPYLQRDEHGFLTYGDFDIYPQCGPQHGRVIYNDDPYHMGRVMVVLDWQFEIEHCINEIESDREVSLHTTPWIRVAQPLGGMHRGSYLVPEIGDEVIVGFEHNNAERPYVIASVHNFEKDFPVKSWVKDESVKDNEYKAIRTRNGHTIEIRDKGKHGYIKIYDNDTHNYVVTYDTDRKLIRLESAGNIELDAKENIVLHAGQNVIINADNDMETNVANDSKIEIGNDMTTKVEHDIIREAGNDIDDKEGQYYTNIAKDAFYAWIADKDICISMDDQEIVLSMKKEDTKNEVRLSESTGIECKTDKEIRADGKQHVTIHSENGIGVISDWSIKVTAQKMAEVNGDSQTVITGGMVKIN